MKKEEPDEYLVKLVRILDKKEKYHYHDRDDSDYYGIRDIENLFGEVDEKDYYKPILVKSAFKSNYKIWKQRKQRQTFISKTVSLHEYTIFKRYDKWS